MRIAILTGASSGMGRDFARALARGAGQARFGAVEALWLVARRAERLRELEQELDFPCRVLPLDLESEEALREVAALLAAERPEVACLVNAAGFGRFAHALDVPLETQMSMINVNVKALAALSALCVPYMPPGSAILNMGSLSAFQPVPYINVYGATKAFVLSHTRALNVELRPRGIRVMAVCPGWVETEFFDHAVSGNGAVTYFNKIWKSEDVVRRAFADLARGRDVSILGASVRFQVLLTKLLPHPLVMWVWMRQQKHSKV